MTVGQECIVSCLKANDSKVLSSIPKKWLEDDEVILLQFCTDYYKSHGELPSEKVISKKFSISSLDVDGKPTFYFEELRKRHVYATITESLPSVVKGAKKDPLKQLESLQKVVSSLASETFSNEDSLYSDDIETRINAYKERIGSGGVTYLSMGVPDMDKLFYGYRKNDLITIGGRSGQGKTWSLCYLVQMLENEVKKDPKKWGDIIFISNEMGEDEIKERLDCIRFNLPYGKFLSGELTLKERSRYFKGLRGLVESPSKIRVVPHCQTVDELATIIGIYNPCAVFIDGSYLMEGKMQEGWEKIVYITRNLKRLAKTFNVPIINTTQLKRGTAKGSSKFGLDGQDDFAYSSSYSQDSDLAIRMFQDAEMKYHNLVGMEVVKGRRVKTGTRLYFLNDLESMEQSITQDDEEDDNAEQETDVMDI